MNDKELYRQKRQAKLNEWKADLDKLKARASGASADAQLELNKHIKALDAKIADGKTRLAALADASEEAWASIKSGVDSAWDSLKSGFSDAAAKFNN